MKRYLTSLAVIPPLVLMIMSSCCISRHSGFDMKRIISDGDSTAVTVMGDSVYSILASPDKISVSNLSIRLASEATKEICLNPDCTGTLLFLIGAPQNYRSNTVVYGTFNPSVVYKFHQGKKSVDVALDFGLRKWAVRDRDGCNLFMRDLQQWHGLLRFSRLLYPDDPFLESIENE